MKAALLVTAVVAAAIGFAMREVHAGSPVMWVGLIVPYVVLAALSIRKFHHDGTLRDVLRLRSGDFTIGFLIAAVLFGGAYGIHHFLFSAGSTKMVWLYRIAIELGMTRPSPGLLALVAVVGALEELVWRGFVLGAL